MRWLGVVRGRDLRLWVLRGALMLSFLAISFPVGVKAARWGDNILRAQMGVSPSRSHNVAETYPRLIVLEVVIHSGQTFLQVDLILELGPHISKDFSREIVGN